MNQITFLISELRKVCNIEFSVSKIGQRTYALTSRQAYETDKILYFHSLNALKSHLESLLSEWKNVSTLNEIETKTFSFELEKNYFIVVNGENVDFSDFVWADWFDILIQLDSSLIYAEWEIKELKLFYSPIWKATITIQKKE